MATVTLTINVRFQSPVVSRFLFETENVVTKLVTAKLNFGDQMTAISINLEIKT